MWNKFIDDWKTPVEYIDREAANLALAEQGFDWDKAKQALASVPAADVVPVVRCKDCKHFNHARMECENEAVSTDYEGGAQYSLNFELDDFCSYGERMDGGADNA